MNSTPETKHNVRLFEDPCRTPRSIQRVLSPDKGNQEVACMGWSSAIRESIDRLEVIGGPEPAYLVSIHWGMASGGVNDPAKQHLWEHDIDYMDVFLYFQLFPEIGDGLTVESLYLQTTEPPWKGFPWDVESFKRAMQLVRVHILSYDEPSTNEFKDDDE